MKTEILPIDSVKQHLLIPYDSFSQMSTIYLTCIKIRAVQSRIRAASAGCANFSTAQNIIRAKSFVVASKDKACVQNTNKN